MNNIPKELVDKFDEAFAKPGTKVPIGRMVVCDWCSGDFTNSERSGGFIFQSRATCPDCAPRLEASAIKYDETKFIRERCAEGQSFGDFIREFRGPDAGIKVIGLVPRMIEDADEGCSD